MMKVDLIRRAPSSFLISSTWQARTAHVSIVGNITIERRGNYEYAISNVNMAFEQTDKVLVGARSD